VGVAAAAVGAEQQAAGQIGAGAARHAVDEGFRPLAVAGDDAVAQHHPRRVDQPGLVVAGDGDVEQLGLRLQVLGTPAAAVVQTGGAFQFSVAVVAQRAVGQAELATVEDGRAAAVAAAVADEQRAGDVGMPFVVQPAAFAAVVVVRTAAVTDPAVANPERTGVVDASAGTQRGLATAGPVTEDVAGVQQQAAAVEDAAALAVLVHGGGAIVDHPYAHQLGIALVGQAAAAKVGVTAGEAQITQQQAPFRQHVEQPVDAIAVQHGGRVATTDHGELAGHVKIADQVVVLLQGLALVVVQVGPAQSVFAGFQNDARLAKGIAGADGV